MEDNLPFHGENFFFPWKIFSYHGRFFLTMVIFFLPWKIFLLPWRIFSYHGRFFSYHGRFFLTMGDFFIKTISLTPTKWVIIGRPPRGQREQGRLVEGEVAREASQRARHHATEARAGGGMRDWA